VAVVLEPKTRHGKYKLIQSRMRAVEPWDGTIWRVIETRDRVKFAPGKRGPWHLIQPPVKTDTRFQRWVHAVDDPNFILRPNDQVQP